MSHARFCFVTASVLEGVPVAVAHTAAASSSSATASPSLPLSSPERMKVSRAGGPESKASGRGRSSRAMCVEYPIQLIPNQSVRQRRTAHWLTNGPLAPHVVLLNDRKLKETSDGEVIGGKNEGRQLGI